jgi:hypothetical protein
MGTGIEWLVLLLVIPIAQKLADFSMPGLVEMLWKLFVIVLAKNLVIAVAALAVGSFAGGLVGLAVFWIGMVKVFEVDFFGAIIIIVVSWLLQIFVIAAVIAGAGAAS